MRRCAFFLFLLVTSTIAGAQSDTTARSGLRYVRGVVLGPGAPLQGANVFDLETLEGAITGADGRFAIPVADSSRTQVHLTARHIGYKPADTTVAVGGDTLVITLEPFAGLSSIAVLAGRYTANAQRTATLTPTEVVMTPGSNADIIGALKTLPGVQNADEGTGLYVRGGDFTETRIFLDGAPLFTAYQFEAPTGSVAGTINPFLTSSISFSAGGFGAQWGNALSGVVDLRTQGAPQRSFTNVNASIIGATVSGGLALPDHIGVTATAGAVDLSKMLDLNGNVRSYSSPPHGATVSGLAAWEYGREGAVKIFALRQTNALGIPVDDPAAISTYTSARTSDIVVASWHDSTAAWRPFVSASTSGLGRDESKGAYDLVSSLRSTQLRGELGYAWSDRVSVTGGAEAERVSANFAGTFPANAYDPGAGAPTTSSSLDAAGTRDAAFLSLDTRPTASTELIAGARSDRSGFSTARTSDPRVSFAWVPREQLTFTASWGVYHQVADPAFLDRLPSGGALPSLSSRMAIAGVQWGEEPRMVRLELWTKHDDDLVGLTQQYVTVGALTGRARGADLFVRGIAPDSLKWRVTYSASRSRRTDPNTGVDALAPFDVTSSVTAILERDWGTGWHAGLAWKYATGHPFTDVTGATYDATAHVYVPQYAAPDAQRLPDFQRTDLLLSKQRPFGGDRFGVAYIGINNVFNHVNTFSYTWSSDYTQRIPVRSTVSRTVFVGANLVLLRHQ